MSVSATNWAWSQTMEPTFKLVLMALCDCHNASTGLCNPSYDFIADKACVSTRTAMRAVRHLTEEGYISLLKSKAADGTQRANTYVLHMEKSECQIVTQTSSRVTNTALPCDIRVTRNKLEEPELKTEQKENSLFKAFWDQYPNKTAKAYSEKQFSKLSLQEQSAVVASMPKFLEWLEDKHKTFKDYSPPNPSTYINQRRFDDYRAAPLDWEQIIDTARLLDAWSPKKWGPAPFTDGCIVPQELLTQSDNRPWKEWRPAS
jgi:Helix-turn-helix domain